MQGRWHFGSEAARSGRYMYLTAACTLPRAVAIQELGRRRREFVLVGMGLLLVAIPANIGAFEGPLYNESYSRTNVELSSPRLVCPSRTPCRATCDPFRKRIRATGTHHGVVARRASRRRSA